MDKLAKVRDEIEKLKSQLLRGACSSQIAMETRCKEEAYNEVLAILDSMQEEPVSEDLEEAAKRYLYSNILYDDVYVGNPTDKDCIEMFKAGAKWQKQKDEKNIGELQWNAHEEGWDECKQEMMAKAVKVKISNASIISLPVNCNLKVGDKVLIIKED